MERCLVKKPVHARSHKIDYLHVVKVDENAAMPETHCSTNLFQDFLLQKINKH